MLRCVGAVSTALLVRTTDCCATCRQACRRYSFNSTSGRKFRLPVPVFQINERLLEFYANLEGMGREWRKEGRGEQYSHFFSSTSSPGLQSIVEAMLLVFGTFGINGYSSLSYSTPKLLISGSSTCRPERRRVYLS